jgi:hypothetical protein
MIDSSSEDMHKFNTVKVVSSPCKKNVFALKQYRS